MTSDSKSLKAHFLRIGEEPLLASALEKFDGLGLCEICQTSNCKISAANICTSRIPGLPPMDLLGNKLTDPSWGFLREEDSPFPRTKAPRSASLAREGARIQGHHGYLGSSVHG